MTETLTTALTTPPVSDGRGGYLCPVCQHGPFKTPARALALCPNRGGRNHPEPPKPRINYD